MEICMYKCAWIIFPWDIGCTNFLNIGSVILMEMQMGPAAGLLGLK